MKILRAVLLVVVAYALMHGFEWALTQSLFWIAPPLFGISAWRHIFDASIPEVAAILAAWFMNSTINRHSLSFLGFRRRGAVKCIMLGVLIGSVSYCAWVAIDLLADWYRILGPNPYFRLLPPLAAAMLYSFGEEVLFRGYIFRTLEEGAGTWVAVLGSSALFALMHVARWSGGDMGEMVVKPLISHFIFGVLLSSSYLLTRNVWTSFGLHWAWDFCALLFFEGDGIRTIYRYIYYTSAFKVSGEAFWIVTLMCAAISVVLIAISIRRGHWRPWRGAGMDYLSETSS